MADVCKNLLQSNLEHTAQQLHSRIDSLKKDLGNSETIQKDFMQFSQTLQVSSYEQCMCLIIGNLDASLRIQSFDYCCSL